MKKGNMAIYVAATFVIVLLVVVVVMFISNKYTFSFSTTSDNTLATQCISSKMEVYRVSAEEALAECKALHPKIKDDSVWEAAMNDAIRQTGGSVATSDESAEDSGSGGSVNSKWPIV